MILTSYIALLFAAGIAAASLLLIAVALWVGNWLMLELRGDDRD